MHMREVEIGIEEIGPTNSEEHRKLDVAFAFIRAAIVPFLGSEDVEGLADALVKRAIEMTGERT